MGSFREWWRRLIGSVMASRRDQDMEEEIRSHLEFAAERIRRSGFPAGEAERTARLEVGAVAQTMESMRDQRGLPWLDDLRNDLRHSVRSLGRTPAFTIVALATLALGIGANTAIFSVVNSVLLRPLPYSKPEQLLRLTAGFPAIARSSDTVSIPEYQELRRMNQSFAVVGAYTTGSDVYTSGEMNLVAGDRPLRVRSMSVDPQLFRALGLQPAQGRLFEDREISFETRGLAAPVAILSHELWQDSFDSQPSVGQTVNIDGRPHQIVGIMPPGADVMDNQTQLWLPLGFVSEIGSARDFHVVHIIGRLKEGVTEEAAQAELNALIETWGERTGASGHLPVLQPSRPVDHTFRLEPLQQAIVGDAGRSIWILQVAVGLVLLIACANLGNLLLARAESRGREFALRAALGAGRARLLRQTVAEGLLLSMTGGLLGLCLAAAAVPAMAVAYRTSVPRMSAVAVDLRVLLFTLAIAIATGVLFGLAPMAHRRLSDLMTALKNDGTRTTSGAGRHHLRRTLVVAEVAIAVMLVIAAGLLIRTVYNLSTVNAGFDRSRLVTFSMSLAEPYDPDTRLLAYQLLLDKLRAQPGVHSAAIMSGLPPNRRPTAAPTRIENYVNGDGRPFEVIDYYQAVAGDYFQTMGIPIVAGRGFEPVDSGTAGRVVVVNETLANRIWKGQNPIGQRVRPNMGVFGFGDNPWCTVIGVARDVKQGGVDKDVGTELYVSLDHVGLAPPTMNVVLQTSLPPASLSRTLERLVHEVDSSVPIVRLRDMDTVFADSIRRPRFLTQLLGAFASLALLLAVIGTYGVLSYMVTERRHEIGIRIALGATRSTIFARVMHQGLLLTVIGLAAGVAGAFGLNQLIASLLFGVETTDIATLTIVIASITIAAAIASWLPALRASRLDPIALLRHE